MQLPPIISNVWLNLNVRLLIYYSLIVPLFLSLSLFFSVSIFLSVSTDQRLDLNKLSPNDSDTVRGQIVGEYW